MRKSILVFEHGREARLHGTRVQLRPVYKKLVDAGYATRHSTKGQGKGRMMLVTEAPLKVAKEVVSGHRTLFNMRRSKKNPACVVCHGDLVFMGGLGNLKWFRCRACGMEQSRKARARRKVRVVRKNPSRSHADIDRLVQEARQRFGPKFRVKPGYEWKEGTVLWSGEGAVLPDGMPAFDYYAEDPNERTYVMGVHKSVEAWAKKHGLFWEPHDPGTYMAYEANPRQRRNPIEPVGGGHMITGKAVQLYRLLALKHALKLELATGMKMSRGISPFAIVKRELGFTGNKQKVYDQLVKYIEQVGPGLAQNPGGEFAGVKYWKVWSWIKQYGRWQFIAKVRATYPEIKRHFPGARVSRLDMLVGEVRVMKKSQVLVPAKVRK